MANITYKINQNGVISYQTIEVPRTPEEIAKDKASSDELFKIIKTSNKTKHNIINAIEKNDYEEFLKAIAHYHKKSDLVENSDVYIENRKKNIHLFLSILEENDKPYLIDNAIKFLSDTYINEEFIIIALWSMYHEDKTKELLSNTTCTIKEKSYDAFFDMFSPQNKLQSKLPFGITETEKFLINRKKEFFDLAKIIFVNQLNEKIPNKPEGPKKLKI